MLALCAAIALAPALAEARAGSSSRGSGSYSGRSGSTMQSPSVGSRSSRTYDSNEATPIERSMTTPAKPAVSGTTSGGPGYSAGYASGGFFQQHPILSGIAAGFVGSWIGSMLFSHSSAAADTADWHQASNTSPTGSLIGSLLPYLLLGGLGWLLFRLLRRRAPARFAGVSGYESTAPGQPIRGYGQSILAVPQSTTALEITDADQGAFTEVLTEVQAAWSRGDLSALKRRVTPEMLSYFSEALSKNTSEGIENRVEQVELLHGDLTESWAEQDLQYATAKLTWKALDYTVRADRKSTDADYLVEGSSATPSEATEVWTFARSRGGHWLLSAIQQV